jgi:beta-glucosidase
MAFDISTADIASFNETSSSWVAEAGEYTLRVGASSTKILLTKTFTLDEVIQGEAVSRSLLLNRKIEGLHK